MTLYFEALIILVFRSSIRGLWIEQRVYFFLRAHILRTRPLSILLRSSEETWEAKTRLTYPLIIVPLGCLAEIFIGNIFFFYFSTICLRILKTQTNTVFLRSHLSTFEQNSSKKSVGTSTAAGEYLRYISQSARFIFPFTFLQDTMVGSSAMT